MNKTLARCILIVYIGVAVVLSFVRPEVFGDNNSFLDEFVNHNFLGFMGVVVTITLASSANIHIELNKLEEKLEAEIFSKTREAVKRSAFSLIWCLFFSVLVVVCKPLVVHGKIEASIVNASALFIILFAILVLVDLTKLAFSIKPH